MASITDLKQRYDCHDVAEALGLKRPGNKGHYHSPFHDDKTPSLSVNKNDPRYFKDYSNETDEHASGSIIDLVMYIEDLTEPGEAMKRLHEIFNIPPDPPKDSGQPRAKRSRAEYVADKCFESVLPAKEYLVNERKLDEEIVDRAIRRKAVGFNDWHSDTREPGEAMYGGPAVAFIVRSLNPGQVMAVDTRYLNAELNGGVKTQAIGEKYGYPFFTCRKEIERAHTVYIVESPINALTVECAKLPGTAAIATRGTGNVNIDWRFLAGKQVILCMDNDDPNEKGHCPGAAAAWSLHEQLTGLNISALMVDQIMWNDFGWNDLNDIIQEEGSSEVKKRLRKIEQWMIPGLPGKGDVEVKRALEQGDREPKSRVFIPPHDFVQYWRFRAKEDFVSFVKDSKEDEDGNTQKSFTDVCGFRIASLSRVRISGVTAMMTGEKDTEAQTVFSGSVQTPRHGPELQRRVFEDEHLHNIDKWKKFGPVFAPSQFLRMVNIMERSAHLGSRDAVNFVGLAWRDGKTIVNEGPDCYFTDPAQQCPYHALQFPSGPVTDAKRVVEAYGATFKKNTALQLLVWSLGGHLKAYLGFWPHMMLQADKGAGKSTLIKRLERTIGFTMLSGQSTESAFRLLTSISCTSHPVGWEELSARKQDVIDKAVNMLQESYQYTFTKRNSTMTTFVLCAPVLLAGEDVPVKSLYGKLVRTNLLGKNKGDLMPEDLPPFPVLQWLQWLADLPKKRVMELFHTIHGFMAEKSRAAGDDDGAARVINNYAAYVTAWRLLCEFADIPREYGNYIHDQVEVMNDFIAETSGSREPWVWITEIALNEIDSGRFLPPYAYEVLQTDGALVEEKECLLIRPSHIISHISTSTHLRDKWNALPVKTDRVYKKQLQQAGVIFKTPVEKTIKGHRYSNMIALDLDALAEFGLHASPPVSDQVG